MVLHPEDQKLVLERPAPGFSPERNRQVVMASIQKHRNLQAKKRKEYIEKIGERAEALAYYLDHKLNQGKGLSVEQYFGKRVLGHLRGERIVERARRAELENKRFVLL